MDREPLDVHGRRCARHRQPLLFGVETTNIAISIVTLLMVFVLQNTQNRDSAALHLKLDEIVQAESDARDDVAGVESKSEPEIRELSREERDVSAAAVGE